ncbi:MAG: 4Fe-4S binding protein [Chloroflexi bacterium]|nr:4Fe-4S binding protein [Chloroflexota bacterium]
MPKYTLRIEEYACWGCQTCEVACKQEYNPVEAREGVKYITVWPDGPKPVNGNLEFTWRVTVCQHCEEPDCVPACPTEAITKRPDGIVILDRELCNGCQACLPACPYDAIAFDDASGTAAKCNLCYHRVDHGLYPACADNVCLAHCIYFGEPAEIEKLIAEKQAARAC